VIVALPQGFVGLAGGQGWRTRLIRKS